MALMTGSHEIIKYVSIFDNAFMNYRWWFSWVFRIGMLIVANIQFKSKSICNSVTNKSSMHICNTCGSSENGRRFCLKTSQRTPEAHHIDQFRYFFPFVAEKSRSHKYDILSQPWVMSSEDTHPEGYPRYSSLNHKHTADVVLRGTQSDK